MGSWKVSAEQIEVFPHNNSDRMDIAKVGMFQLVVAKSNGYKTGDIIVFAPKRSVLPEDLRPSYCNSDTGASYLVGKEHDRVSSIRLRGELSEGVTIDPKYVADKLGVDNVNVLPIGEDISQALGISLYEPPIPAGFGGLLKRLDINAPFRQHDVEGFAIYANEFVEGEEVVVSEKIHGSQINFLMTPEGEVHLTSKGLAEKSVEILEDEKNIYWRAVRNTNLPEILAKDYFGHVVQVFGEVFPAQGMAWSYGAEANKPTLRIFRLVLDGVEVSLDNVKWTSDDVLKLWVPILFQGPYNEAVIRALAKGKEQVSGHELHIREGGVVTPAVPRPSREGWNLSLKVINPKFNGSDDDAS